MTSTAKVEANRRNATFSTGPRTEAGKAAAALNALRHGLTAEAPLLPDEDRRAFEQLRAALMQQFNPGGALEELLVDRIVLAVWRLQRAARIETQVLHSAQADASLPALVARDFKAPDLGYAFCRDVRSGDCLGKLARYEGGYERSLYRALHELQRLQAVRAGQPVPPPVTVDVTVDGGFVSQKPPPLVELPEL